MPDVLNWQFPKNVADTLIGWTSDGRGLENKDADDLVGYIGTSKVVATRTALKAIDTTKVTLVFLTESGREGSFIWTLGNFAARVTADVYEGAFLAGDGIASSVGAWVRVRPKRTHDLQWYGASTSAAADNQPVFDSVVAVAKLEGGGTIYVSGFYRVQNVCTIDGSVSIILQGTNRESGFYRSGTSGAILRVTGSRHTVNDLLFSSALYTTTASDIVVQFDDTVQCYMERCKVQGGYYPLVVSGGACTDNTFINNTFTFGMGPAQAIVFDLTAGANGAQHFYRCTFNQSWPVYSPSLSEALYMGARANTTAYNVNEIVTIGAHTWQCRVAGTSAGTVPTTTGIWYGADLSDGATLKWRLVGFTSFTGITFDTNTHYNTVRECDITGPYLYGIAFYNTFAGDAPNDIKIETCTVHGPKQIAVYADAVRNITIDKLNAWNPSDNTAAALYGVFWNGTGFLKVTNSSIYKFTEDVYIGADNAQVSGNSLAGATRAVRVANNVTRFSITGNDCGSISGFSTFSVNGVTIGTGCDNFQVTNNDLSETTTQITDNSSSSATKVIKNNIGLGAAFESPASLQLLFRLSGADLNVTTDQTFTKMGDFTNYEIISIRATNPSSNVGTAAGGIYQAAAKAGNPIVAAAQVYSDMTGANVGGTTLTIAAAGRGLLSATPILSLTTANGVATTADFDIMGFAKS